MPFYPTINVPEEKRIFTNTFAGYNHNLKIADGEFFEEQNMCSDDYPVLSSRKPRGLVRVLDTCQGIIAKDDLYYVNNNRLYKNGTATPVRNLSAGEKQLVSMGAYICIFPDKRYYNTVDPTDYGWMDSEFTSSGNVYIQPCLADGSSFTQTVSATEPSNPFNGQLWLDTSITPNELKRFSEAQSAWIDEVPYTKIKFMTRNIIPTDFSAGDGIILSVSDSALASKLLLEFDSSENRYKQFFTVQALGGGANEDDWLVIPCPLNETINTTVQIKVSRPVPDMDFVVEIKNRLWGCFYGTRNGKTVNEIYACALGDFKNWNLYEGLSTDSYTASVGSDGPWTGAAVFMGYPLFFKENRVHQVSVNAKGAHRIDDTLMRGVQAGSARSLAICKEDLLYKSSEEVCIFQSVFPKGISRDFGDEKYSSAAAGSFMNKYYLSALNSEGEPVLFVYDKDTNIWHKLDPLRVKQFASMGPELYALCDYDEALGGYPVYAFNGTTGTLEETVSWSFESGDMYLDEPDNKYVKRYDIRLKAEEPESLRLEIQYDSSGIWKQYPVYDPHPAQQVAPPSPGREGEGSLRTYTIPVLPRRCDHLRYRISGTGDVKIYSIARVVEVGSDVS